MDESKHDIATHAATSSGTRFCILIPPLLRRSTGGDTVRSSWLMRQAVQPLHTRVGFGQPFNARAQHGSRASAAAPGPTRARQLPCESHFASVRRRRTWATPRIATSRENNVDCASATFMARSQLVLDDRDGILDALGVAMSTPKSSRPMHECSIHSPVFALPYRDGARPRRRAARP